MDELAAAVRACTALLFVGAGVSMNLGTPSWAELTAHMAAKLGYDPAEFAKLGDPQTLAEFYALEAGSLGSLRSWMDVEWHRQAEKKVRRSEVHRLIVELGFPVIYTTNYDATWSWPTRPTASRTRRSPTSATWAGCGRGAEVVKLHGDLEDDGAIVLTESSHFDRLALDGPFDLKLRTDLLGRAALFVGYSVSDVSIRYLLYRLHRLWAGSAYEKARPRAYVYLGDPNPVQARVLESWGIVPLFAEEGDIGEGLGRLLERLAAG